MSNDQKTKVRKPSSTDLMNERIHELADRTKLDSWTSFVEELQVPSDLAPAVITMRSEFVNAVKPRALSEAECATLYKFIAGLLDTNVALRQHAQDLASMIDNWQTMLTGLQTMALKIDHFANFRPLGEKEDEED